MILPILPIPNDTAVFGLTGEASAGLLSEKMFDVSVLRHVDQATPNGAKRRLRSASPTSRRWRQSNTRPCTPLGCKCCLGIVTQGALRDPGLRCSTALRLS